MSALRPRGRRRARLAAHLSRRARWRWPEIVFWLAILGADLRFAVARGDHQRGADRRPVRVVARSHPRLTGIVSLGQAAFFGLGAYTAAILANAGYADPTLGLVFGAAVAASSASPPRRCCLRGADLTRLMVTMGVSLMLGELANRTAG